MSKATRTMLAILLLASLAVGQSVADAAKASKNNAAASHVFGEDDLDSLRTKAHASGRGANNDFCDSGCQDEVLGMLSQKVSREQAQSILTEGLTLAREDGEWQELIGRVQTAVCNEKKSGSLGSGDAALQREVLLRVSREQKEMAELQDKALRSASQSDVNELKERSAKLVVIGVGVKRMASGQGCSVN